MGSYRQRFLHDLATLVTFLAGEARVHSYHLVTSSCSLLFKDVEECAPTSVHDALRHMMVLDHVGDLKVFNCNTLIAFSIGFRRLEMVITPLPRNLEMGLRRATSSLAASMTAFLASAQLALLASQGSLRGAIETRVLNGVALTIRQKGLEANVNTDVRMLTDALEMVRARFGLTHDEGIPMPIRTVYQVNSLGDALYRALYLDFEGFPDLLGYDEVLLVFMQGHIFAILAQLDGMPAVGFLKTREAYLRDAQAPGCKKAFEGLGESIRKHLDRGGRHILTTASFVVCGQIVLCGKRAFLGILCLDRLQHFIRELAGRCQAAHKQARLCFIWIQAVFKCPHASILLQPMRNVKWIVPPAGGRQFTHLAKASGPLAA